MSSGDRLPRRGKTMGQNKRKQQTESVAETLHRDLKNFLNIIICIYMLLILAVLPFYNREGYAYIGTDKCNFFCKTGAAAGRTAIVVLILYLAFSLAVACQKKYTFAQILSVCRESCSVTDAFAGFYGVSLILSYLCSDYRDKILWGADGWYMGFLSQLILVGSYFLIAKCWKPRKWLFCLMMPVSAAVFLLGYLNRFDLDPLGMAIDNSFFISTIGNINWYCGYQMSVFFAGAALLWQGRTLKVWQKLLLMFYTMLGFGSLIVQGSSSGIVATAVVLLAMFCLSVSDSERMYLFWQEMVLLGAAFLVTYVFQKFGKSGINYEDGVITVLTDGKLVFLVTIVSVLGFAGMVISRKRGYYPKKFLRISAVLAVGMVVTAVSVFAAAIIANTLNPGSLGALSANELFIFSDTWGSNRGATWKAGVMCFLEQDILHKLVGVGPDGMVAFLYQGGSSELQELVWKVFPTAHLTNAHNEWLTILVDVGILGCIGFVGMMVSAIVRFLGKKNSDILSRACGLCLLAYTVNNMFSFQQAMNTPTIFIVLGMGEAFRRSSLKD